MPGYCDGVTCTESRGLAPKQLQTEDIAEAARAKDTQDWGLDDDLFGDNQFDMDDLDADGFQDLSFDDGSMF